MSRFLSSVAAIFMPPFKGLSVVVVLYILWAQLVYPHNDILRGNLPDPDDYMYLTQVLDWMNGQGWYDNIQHRMNPPMGTPIHFSRLVQIPLAAGIMFFKMLGLKPHGAAMVTALIEPFILLGLCLSVMRRVTTYVVSARWAGASSYVALFCVGLLFEFTPGHVDHHGLVILLVMATVACLLRWVDSRDDFKAQRISAISAGLLLALTMTIALECLPWILLFSAFVGVKALRCGGSVARSGALYGLALLIGMILGLALTRPPSTILDNDILTFSVTYVILAIAIAIPLALGALTSKASAPLRWVMGLGVAGLCGFFFLQRFPDLLTGPYGAIDAQLVPLLLNQVEEARPILDGENGFQHLLNLMGMGFIALPAAFYFMAKAQGVHKWQWGLLTSILGSSFFLSIFYQYRFVGMESAAAIPPLVALLERGWLWAGRSLHGRRKVFAEIGFLLLIGPLPSVIIPSLFDSRSFNLGFFLFPVDSGHTPCDMSHLQYELRDPLGLGDKQHVIASFMDLGPEFLFRTDHEVLAAPYHMNVQGNLDAARLLSTPYAEESENILRRRGVDLLIVCRSVPNYLAPTGGTPSLIERLSHGDTPTWLRRLRTPDDKDFIIYRVLTAEVPADANTPQEKK